MRRILRPALVIASAVAVATCADAPTGPRNARNGNLLHGRIAVAAQLTRSASESAARLTQFGFAIDNVGITLRRVAGGSMVLDTTIIVTPGQTLSLALPVTVTTVDEQFVARVLMRQGTTVLYSGEHTVRATLDGATNPPPPVVIEVAYAGPGAAATRISITPRDSVFATTARPQFSVIGTDASGAVVPGVPIVWSTSDAAMAAVHPSTGVVTPGNRRGTVTLRALSLSGLTDTLPLTLRSPAASIAVASGAGQTAPAGAALEAPLVVEVLAADGLPSPGEVVTFTTTGPGSIAPASAVTDANGRASASIVLGATLGDQQFVATVAGLPPASATQHAMAGAPASLTAPAADTLRGVAGQALAAPLVVHVRDALGLPVSAATVSWSVSGAGGTVSAATSETSADGAASTGFTFGSTAGPSVVTAALGELTATFALLASHDVPSQLVIVSGDAQQAPPSTALAPLVVRLADQHGNPVGGHPVAWSRTQGSGTLAAASSATGTDGTASVGYTTGAVAGTERVTATAAGVEAVFTATTQAGSPAQLHRVAGDSQTVVAGTTVPVRLKARVTDASGNGVASLVAVGVTAPDGTTQSQTGIATDTAGYVFVPLTLLERPRTAGRYTAVVKLATPATQVAFSLDVVPAPAAAITLVAAPSTATSGARLSPQPVVQLVDSIGNYVSQGGVEIAASVASGATLSGVAAKTTTSSGSAGFGDLAITAPAGPVTLTFAAASLTPASIQVAVGAAPVASVRIVSGEGQTGAAGRTLVLPLVIEVVAADGLPFVGQPVTFGTMGIGSIAPASGVTDASGRASASITLGAHLGDQSFTVTVPGLPRLMAVQHAVAGAPATLTAAATDTVRGVAAQPLAAPLVVHVRDSVGLPITGVTVSWTASAGTLDASTSMTDTSGAALVHFTFGTAAGASGVTATLGHMSASFALLATPDAPSQLTIVGGNAQDTSSSTVLAPFVVRLADVHGNAVAGQDVAWTRTQGSGTLAAASSATTADGLASTVYTTGTLAGTDSITASVAGLKAIFTATVRAGTASTLKRIAGDSQTVVAGTPLPVRLTAQVTDVNGNGVAALVDIGVTAPDGTTQTQTGIATDTAGYVFVPLTLLERPRTAGRYTAVVKLQAAPATQVAFTLDVVPAPPAAITLVAAPSTATSGTLLSPQPSLQLVDSLGNVSPTAGVSITASAGGAVLGGTATVATDSTGRASYTDLVIDGSGVIPLTFGAEGLTGASQSVTVEAAPVEEPPPTQPALTVSLYTADQVRISQFHGSVGGLGVIVRDTANAPVAGIPVHFILAADGSHGSFTGAGFEVVGQTDPAGVATFHNWSPPSAAGSYTLTAQARVDSANVGAPIALTAVRSVWTYALTASPAAPIAGDTTQVSAALVDGAGVAVAEAGRVVTWTSSATLSAATSVTDSTGVARVTITTLRTPSTITASATDPAGVTGSFQFTSRSAGGTVSVTPQHDTLTSLGDQRQLTASLVDSAGAPVAGTFTWTSRNPAAVTVDTNGLVTAITTGAAYVVASEIGGVSDSALVVVQQRVASVNVTPGTASLRLGGRQQFTAAAVDGRGNPIGSPVFSWASTSPAVARVDTAGTVEALSLGTTEIRATASGVTGVGALTVVTPITRIAVTGVDSAGGTIADGTPLTAFGQARRFVAIAYDTLDQPMSGVSFAWTSSNPSVAQLDSVAAASAQARAAANGTTSIRATVHGVVGSASLGVQQVLAGIKLTPESATIGVNGTVGMIARGVDANGYFISTGTFAYTSSNPGVTTVESTTGVVRGVALGTAAITAASGNIVSNGATVTVSQSVPPVISFGRDTLSVGRGSSTEIPVYLSTPHSGAVTVQLSVADTFAYFNPATVTFQAGQTAVNAKLFGRNAGTTSVHAVDASGTGFAGDTAALTVRATLKLAVTSYSMNATDSRATQVLLSDPSPAGGTYVTFTFGTPGIASASPNPAFIPEGQLAADVVITGILTGATSATTTMVPSAPGVSGASVNVTVYPAAVLLSTGAIRMGAGQYRDDTYAYVHTNQSTPLTLTLTSSDTTVAGVPQTITIPANSNYAYFRTSARTPGNVTVAVTSPGWSSPTPMAVRSTTPRVTVCCAASLTTTAPARNVTVYSTDSTGAAAKRTNSLVVRLISRDTSIIKVLDSTVTIAAGQYYTSAGRIMPGGAAGSTYLRVEAGGHQPADSVLFTVTGPQLQWGSTFGRLGAGQIATNNYIYTPHNVTEPLELTITSSDSTIVAPTTVTTIPSGTNYRYIDVRGQSPGTVTLTVSAPGYSPASMTYVTTTPSVVLAGGGTVNDFAAPRTVTVYSTDSVGTAHNRQAALAVSLASSDTNVIKVDSAGIIAAGTYYTNTARATIVGTGTAQVIATADGHRPDTVTYTVVMPQVQFNAASYMLGATQTRDFYVYTPDNRTSELAVTFTQVNGNALAAPAGATIPSGTNYVYFGVNARSAGVDTIIASAAGYRPDTLVVRVTTPRLTASTLPSGKTTTSPPFHVTVYSADSLGTVHNVTDTVVVEITSSDTAVIRPASRYATILRGSYYVQPSINIVGPGSASLTYADTSGRYVPHTTAAMTVTGPSLAMSQPTYRIGMAQTTGTNGMYVHVPNAVSSPLVVNLASTSTRVATVPATVTIPAGSSYAYFQVTAGDTVGTIQVQATATGYTATTMSVQVTVPQFIISTSGSAYTTTSPRSIIVYAADADGNARHVREDLTVTLTSSTPGVAAVDSATVTIRAGAYYSNTAKWTPGTVGTARISASDERAVYQKYRSAFADVSVTLPPAYLSGVPSALGIGQYTTGAYVSTPDVQPDSVTVTLSHAGVARTSTPSSIIIPASSYYAYFRVAGIAAGPDTLTASIASPEHLPASVVTVVGTGRIDPVSNWPSVLTVGDSVPVTIYVRDPHQNVRNLVAATTWSLSHAANIEFRQGGTAVISVTIPADGDRVTLYVKALAAGTATASIAATNYSTYTNSISVVSP